MIENQSKASKGKLANLSVKRRLPRLNFRLTKLPRVSASRSIIYFSATWPHNNNRPSKQPTVILVLAQIYLRVIDDCLLIDIVVFIWPLGVQLRYTASSPFRTACLSAHGINSSSHTNRDAKNSQRRQIKRLRLVRSIQL